jgi:hypothetical protein
LTNKGVSAVYATPLSLEAGEAGILIMIIVVVRLVARDVSVASSAIVAM